MRAIIRKKIEVAKRRWRPIYQPCKCSDYVGCEKCRARRRQQIRKRKAVGMRPTPLPYKSRWPQPTCECGHCQKCIHREYMREWRKQRERQYQQMRMAGDVFRAYREDVLRNI